MDHSFAISPRRSRSAVAAMLLLAASLLMGMSPEYGDVLMLRHPDTGFSAFRPMQ